MTTTGLHLLITINLTILYFGLTMLFDDVVHYTNVSDDPHVYDFGLKLYVIPTVLSICTWITFFYIILQ